MSYTREQRDAKKAAEAAATPPHITEDTIQAPKVDPVELVKAVAEGHPIEQSSESLIKKDIPSNPPFVPGPVQPLAKPTPFDLASKDLESLTRLQHETNKQRSLDAIKQTVEDAAKLAGDRIRNAPETVALTADPGNISLRDAFIKKFGPSAVKPPKPRYPSSDPRSKMAHLDRATILWYFTYEPEKALKLYKGRHDPFIVGLMEEAERALASK